MIPVVIHFSSFFHDGANPTTFQGCCEQLFKVKILGKKKSLSGVQVKIH